MATGNLVGYRVEVRAGRTSKPQYLKQDLKTTDTIGYVWKKETSAKNAMKSYRAYIANKKIPCASMKVVELIDDTSDSAINMNDKANSPSDNEKSAEGTASAQSEEITAPMNDEAEPVAAENMSMVECFFSVKYAKRLDLFEGLSIEKNAGLRKLQGTYPVLFLSFAAVKTNTYVNARRQICSLIASVTLSRGRSSFTKRLRFLSRRMPPSPRTDSLIRNDRSFLPCSDFTKSVVG